MENDLTQQRLAQAFAAAGLSQAELARLSGIDRGSISLYLSGRYRPKADKLIRLAAALSVTPEWLSGVDDAPAAELALPLPLVTGLDETGGLLTGSETLLVPKTTLRSGRTEDFFALEIQGLAMYPRLLEGDRLVVRRCDAVPEGATAVLAREQTLLVRTLSGGMLLPANPEFPPRSLTPELRLLGRGVALIRTL